MTAPVITNATLDDSTITERESVTFTCNVSNTPTDVWVKVGSARVVLSNTTGTIYSASEKGWNIGVASYATTTITFLASNADGGSIPVNSDTALTVSASSYSTAHEDIWQAIYDRMEDQLVDPRLGSRSPAKWIFATFSDKITTGKDKYPVILVSRIRVGTKRRTYGKVHAPVRWEIDVLSTENEQTDTLTSDVHYAISTYLDTLRCTYGISNVEFDEDDDTFERSGIKVHMKTLRFTGDYGYVE